MGGSNKFYKMPLHKIIQTSPVLIVKKLSFRYHQKKNFKPKAHHTPEEHEIILSQRNEAAILKIAQIKNNTQAAIDALVISRFYSILKKYFKEIFNS